MQICYGSVHYTALHGSIARFIPTYEQAGYSFPGWEPYQSRQTAGTALVVVPGFRNILVHAYMAVDLDTVWDMLEHGPAQFREFIRHAADYLRSHPGTP